MSRRHSAQKREVLPDPKFGDLVLSRFMNVLMYDGKKSTAERIVYAAMDTLKRRVGPNGDPLRMFHDAMDNVKPAVEVRSRRVGGATYQVPVEVRPERRQAPATRRLTEASPQRGENTMEERLSGELMDAANNRGTAVKKREDTHRMAEANKAFSHYRW
jgi:small subunit ribosomal protein S7